MKTGTGIIILASLVFVACGQRTGKEKQPESVKTESIAATIYINPDLTEAWQSPDSLDVPESVLAIPGADYLVVSNINGKPLDFDHNGYISKLSSTGKIRSLHWVDGLNAPKGLAVAGEMLYVSDIRDLVAINLTDGQIVHRYTAADARFLNDVSVDTQGNVYVSDMNGSAIYRLKDTVFSPWLKDEKLAGVNGLLVYNGALYAGTKNQILKIDTGTKRIRVFIDNTGPIDGLVHYRDQQFIISDWSGHVYLVEPGKERVKLLDTTPAKVNAADISYDADRRLLLVPTFSDNRIVAYEVRI
ncbi:MAG: hypothetical protein GXO83_10350 [Chlorobi bacterium]|nr:hypothetical protein [Chlorobiota bacterium]